MLYDKPRSFSWRVRPSFSSSLKPQKVKKRSSVKQNDNLIPNERVNESAVSPVETPKFEQQIDIILQGKPTFTQDLIVSEDTIIDISQMPVIDGIPILIFPNEPTKSVSDENSQELFNQPKHSSVAEYEKIAPVTKNISKDKKDNVSPKVFDISQDKDELDIPILPLKDIPKKEEPETTVNTVNNEEKSAKIVKKVKEKKPKVKVKKEKPAKKAGTKTNLVKIASFFVVLYAGTILSFIIPLRPTYSESEKRNLTPFPKFSADTFASGDYFSDISTWFSDTFPFREQLLSLNSSIKDLYGFEDVAIHGDMDQSDEIPDAPSEEPKIEETTKSPSPSMPTDDELKENGDPNAQKPDFKAQKLGAIIVADDTGYEYYAFSKELAPRFIKAVDKIPDKINAKNVYALINPTSIDIKLNDALRADVKSANQEKALNYFNGSLKKTIAVDTIFAAQRQHRNEYTFFRTDHHWTALGAYYSYNEFCLKKGIATTPLSVYQTKTFDNFKGTFYASSKQSKKLGKNPDKITTYLPFNNAEMTVYRDDGRSFKWDIINDVSDYNSASKYSTFIAGDNALTVIKNNDNPTGETCVVIKDSYGNAFVPFLIPHYSTIYVIDPRHYEKSLADFSKDKDFDDVLFICNISVTRNSSYISALENLLR